ncbi:unnamed protein product [Effrenium voratum]|nr:unnamed protein product [Effrenium voratum]
MQAFAGCSLVLEAPTPRITSSRSEPGFGGVYVGLVGVIHVFAVLCPTLNVAALALCRLLQFGDGVEQRSVKSPAQHDSDTEVSSEGLSKRRSWSDLQERKKPGSLSATQAARQLTAARGKEAKHRPADKGNRALGFLVF